MEHFIQHAPDNARVIKITYPAQYGLRMRLMRPPTRLPDQLSDIIGLRPATPLEYLDRLALHNELFGDDMEFLGLVRQRGGLSMVTSQIFLRGEKPAIPQIEAFMAENGFRRLRGENAYFRAADHLAVFDAHARNFVLTDGVPVPFDVIPQIVTGRMEALLELWL
jgi:Serine/Threonine/Tyrosine Kinase found in polyvalent proteins